MVLRANLIELLLEKVGLVGFKLVPIVNSLVNGAHDIGL